MEVTEKVGLVDFLVLSQGENGVGIKTEVRKQNN